MSRLNKDGAVFHFRLISPALLAALLVGFSVLPGSGAAAQDGNVRSVSPESFLRRPARSAAQVVEQVRGDIIVRARFARFFHLPPGRVAAFLQANLVEGAIAETGFYTVQCVRPGGAIYPTKQAFRRGDKVFALRDGQPLLQWACGNPLSAFVTPIEAVAAPRKPDIMTLVPTNDRDILVPIHEAGSRVQAQK